MPVEAKSTGEPGWKWRRLVIFPALGFASWRLMMLEGAADTEINSTIAWGWFVLLYILLLCYTGFATIQDVVAIWATRSGLPYAKRQQPEPAAREDIPEPPAGSPAAG